MKVLIWIVCFFILSVLIVLLKNSGIVLGGIPTAILYLITFWGAKTLTKKLDGKCKDANIEQSETVHSITSENAKDNAGRKINKRVTLIISCLSTTLLLGTVVAFFVNVKNNESVVGNLEMQIESREKEIANNEKELSNTKDLLLNKNKALESANIALEEQSKLVEKYFNEAEMWKSKALDDVADESKSSDTFTSVDSLLTAVKNNSVYYNNKRVTVTGTIIKTNSECLLADLSDVSWLDGNVYFSVGERYQVDQNPNIEVVISSTLQHLYIGQGDLAIVSGKIITSNDKITLHIDNYKLIAFCEEQY